MLSIRKLPIRHRLTLLTALASMTVMLLAVHLMVFYEFARFRHELETDLCTRAEILRASCAATVAAGDQKAAAQMLAALRTDPEIMYARIFARGELFASYDRRGALPVAVSPPVLKEGHGIDRGEAFVSQPILFRGQNVGTLALRADQHEWWAHIKGRASIFLVATLVSLLVALLLTMRLQRIVAGLLRKLAQLAEEVAGRNGSALPAAGVDGDEIELLMGTFNQMLSRIHEQTEAQRASEQRFRQVTESIREVFWLTDVLKSEMIYISPAYEEIWGRTRANLEASPLQWAETIHPEDRDRVLEAAFSQQATGAYDEEYRILRPDGTVRWIHDRAFPVRDQAGRVYRVAGIAEDITRHKELEEQLIEISEREQGRIGRDLHDGLCQLLTGVGLTCSALKRDLGNRSLPEAATAGRIVHGINDAISMARQLARGLHPVNLQSAGLAAALLELAASTRSASSIECAAECSEKAVFRNPTVATHLYRIAQEAVQNAVKHARPTHISIHLTAQDNKIVLAVADDGVGIPQTATAGNGMGLAIMSYRAGMIGGTLETRLAEPRGTIVSCRLPQEPFEGGFSI